MKILPVKNSIMNSVTYVLYEEDVDYCVLIDCGEWGTLKPVLDELGKKVAKQKHNIDDQITERYKRISDCTAR